MQYVLELAFVVIQFRVFEISNFKCTKVSSVYESETEREEKESKKKGKKKQVMNGGQENAMILCRFQFIIRIFCLLFYTHAHAHTHT